MNTTRIALALAALAVLGVPLIATGPAPPGSPPTIDATTSDLVDLLPDSTLAALELRDLSSRWSEIRSQPAIARFQDRFLAGSGIRPDDLPRLAGDRAVLALVPSADGRTPIPVAILSPPSPAEAEGLLDRLAGGADAGPTLVRSRARGALWIAPARATEAWLDAVSRGDGTGAAGVLRLEEVGRRLPPGGIARGWLNPAALRKTLRRQIPQTRPAIVEALGSLAAAELAAVRFAGFRRDLVPGGVVTDAVVGLDRGVLPDGVARALDGAPAGPVLPSPMPGGVAMMASFPTLADAALPWLRFVARDDARGPWRNLEFWIDEIESATRRSLEGDVFALLGDRAWLFVEEDRPTAAFRAVAILETDASERLGEALADLCAWLGDLAVGRSLGLVAPDVEELVVRGRTARRLSFKTPLGEAAGPAFLAAEGHFLLGSGPEALETGLDLLATRASWTVVPVDPATGEPPHEASRISGSALSRLASALTEQVAPDRRHDRFAAAVAGVFESVDEASASVWYEADALRVRGQVRFTGDGDGS